MSTHDPCIADRPGGISLGDERDRQTPGAALIRNRHPLFKRRSLIATRLIALFARAGVPVMSQTLRVGDTGSVPFIIEDPMGDGLSGTSIDLWRRFAEANHLPYDLIRQDPAFKAAMPALRRRNSMS